MTAAADTDLITVVIPTYNRVERLLNAVRSATSQNVAGLIVHIFDNCSTDGTEGTVRGLMAAHPEIRYTRRPANIGSLANYAGAISSVETPYFIPLADDDWLLEGSIQRLLETILRDPSLGAVVSQTVHERSHENQPPYLNPSDDWEFRRYEPEEILPLWAERGHFEWSSILFRTAAAKSVGGPDISVGPCWDVDFQLRFLLGHPVELIRNPGAVFLYHPEQACRETSFAKIEGMFLMILNASQAGRSAAPAIQRAIDSFSSRWLEKIARDLASNGTARDFRQIFRGLRDASIGLDKQARFSSRYAAARLGKFLRR